MTTPANLVTLSTMAKSTTKQRGPHLGGKREYPPVDNCPPAQWAWRTRSPVYRRKIKRSVEAVNAYLRLTRGPANRGVTGTQRDFCHFMADELRNDSERRTKRTTKEQPDAIPTDSVKI